MDRVTEALLAPTGAYVLRLGGGLSWDRVVREVSAMVGRRPIDFDGTNNCSGVNLVTLGVGEYRSASPSPLGLHQEGYEDEQPLGWLALYCVEAVGVGGETLVVDARTLLGSLAPDSYGQLVETDVRFSRHGGDWTPWRSLLERSGDGETMVRFAEPERGFRRVELRPHDRDLLAFLSRTLRAGVVAHAWQAGDLLLIDNHRCLHGRSRIHNGSRRSLLRMAFPFREAEQSTFSSEAVS